MQNEKAGRTPHHVIGDRWLGQYQKSGDLSCRLRIYIINLYILEARNFSEWQVHSELSGSGLDPRSSNQAILTGKIYYIVSSIIYHICSASHMGLQAYSQLSESGHQENRGLTFLLILLRTQLRQLSEIS